MNRSVIMKRIAIPAMVLAGLLTVPAASYLREIYSIGK